MTGTCPAAVDDVAGTADVIGVEAAGRKVEATTGPLGATADGTGAAEIGVEAGVLTLEEATEPPGAVNVVGGEAERCWPVALQATRSNPTEDPPTTRAHHRRPRARRQVTSPTCTSVTPTTCKTHHRAHRLPAKCRRSPATPSQKRSAIPGS
jgi:hypothetical protein